MSPMMPVIDDVYTHTFVVAVCKHIYTVSHKNGANLVLSVTSSNINKF